MKINVGDKCTMRESQNNKQEIQNLFKEIMMREQVEIQPCEININF